MDTPVLNIPSNVTKTSFTASWNTVTNATKYYIDVATDAAFTTYVSGWQNKSVTTTYDTVTGLTDLTHYWVRVKAANADDSDVSAYSYTQEILTGFAVGGISIELANIIAELFNVQGITIEVSTDFNLSVLVRDTANAPINSVQCLVTQQGWVNKGVFDPTISNVEQSGTATAGTTTTLTDTTKSFAVNSLAGKMLSITGGTGAGQLLKIVSNTATVITFATATAPASGSTYEVINYSPAGTPTNGDYYTVNNTGTSYVTGEAEEFTTVDLLVRLSGAWQIKKRRIVYSDSLGVANLNIDYVVNNILTCTKSGYQIERNLLYKISGQHSIDVVMYPVISVIHTSKGYAVSNQPSERNNRYFN